ncbi:MAG: translation elongation factor Ts [Streptosporangiales bacterium]|nr:translation elongation factor Ts [Streptosporangiales bacterium]
MANISAADVKRLREATGAGMMDCKKALTEADGDFDAAVEALRLKGVKDAGKRAARTAGNGLVLSELNGNSEGVLVEINCETDFVAKNAQFQEVAEQVTKAALASKAGDRLALLAADAGNGKTVEKVIEDASASIKEKIELGRYARYEGGYVTTYLHRSDPDLPPTLGVLLQLDSESADIAKDLGQQIAAMRPQYLTRDEVPADVVEKERRIAEELTRSEGKPEKAVPKIVEGRLGAFFKEIVLTEQAFVKEPKKTVAQQLQAAGVEAKGFSRFQVGQA